jgi:hypothetical protein
MQKVLSYFLFGAAATALALPAAQGQPPVGPSLASIEQRFAPCAGMFKQSDVDDLGRVTSDPLEAFESWRRDRFSLMEAPPTLECRSKIWRHLHPAALQRAKSNFEPDIDGFDSPFADLWLKNGLASADTPDAVNNYQGEVQVAINPKNSRQMVAGANSFYRDPTAACQSPAGAGLTYGTQALYGSSDGGTTWTYHCAPWPAAVTGGVSGADAYFGSDPAVAWDNNGNAYAAYMLISQNSAGISAASIVVAKSSDAGLTWASLGIVVNNVANPNASDDKEFLAVDTSNGIFSHPGRLFAIWDENNVEQIAFSDDGVTWTPYVFSTPGFTVGADVKVGPDGTVYAVWNRVYPRNRLGQATGDDTYFSKSTDGGVTWTAPVKIFSHTLASFQNYYLPAAQNERGVNSFPSLDIDRNFLSPYYNRLYIVYADNTTTCCPPNTFGRIDAYERWSSDGGTTWSNRLRVNDDSAGVSHFFPWLGVDPTDGSVNVAWYDTRNDSINQERTQIFYARSVDGGASFQANLNLTDSGPNFNNHVAYSDEDSWTNTNSNANQYGDYMGLAATNRQIHAVWTDSRQFFPGSTGNARVEDIANVTFTNCSAPRVSVPSLSASVSGITISWGIQSWGINATSGSYTLSRFSNSNCTGFGFFVGSYANGTFSAFDSPPASGTYTYLLSATNNCPGTALTPMASTPCSAPINYVKMF